MSGDLQERRRLGGGQARYGEEEPGIKKGKTRGIGKIEGMK